MLDPHAIRKDFPILGTKMNGKPLVFLDNAASSQKPQTVINTIKDLYETGYSNIHRGIYGLSEEASQRYEDVRDKVADFVGAPSRETIVFTTGTTASINLVAYSWGHANLKKGDEIITTQMEHHANIVPWQIIAQQTGAILKFVRVKDDFTLDHDHYTKLLNEKTKLVAITHASNVLGTINPVKEMTAQAHKHGAVVLVDGAQSVPHMPVDVVDIDCDFFVFSAHKMCGPTGVGVLYGKPEILESMPPCFGGGDMIQDVTEEGFSFKKPPERFEPGTPNIAGVIGFGAAIDYLNGIGMDTIHEYEKHLTKLILDKFGAMPEVTIHGPTDPEKRLSVFSFTMGNIHPHDISEILDQEGIAIRAGKLCAHPLVHNLNEPALARASFYFYNTEEEINTLIHGLEKVKETLS